MDVSSYLHCIIEFRIRSTTNGYTYVSRNEFNDEQNALYARISRHSDARFDALGAQIQADRIEIIKRLDRLDARQDKMEKDIGEIISFQRTLMDTFRAFAQDISKQIIVMQQKMTEEFATQAERHNELMARVGKLEHNGQN